MSDARRSSPGVLLWDWPGSHLFTVCTAWRPPGASDHHLWWEGRSFFITSGQYYMWLVICQFWCICIDCAYALIDYACGWLLISFDAYASIVCMWLISFDANRGSLQFLRRLLIIWVSCHHCPYVRQSVHPSTKSFSDSDEIWYVGRGRWVMHDGMPHDPIQGQGQGHETFKVRNSSIFKIYLLRHF